MRLLIFIVLIIFVNLTQASAQAMLTMPSSTYPEPGTFCGLLTLCPKAARPENDTFDHDPIGQAVLSHQKRLVAFEIKVTEIEATKPTPIPSQ
jgi:hypothetical protein